MAIRDAVQALGIQVRAGLHTGECEVRGEDIGGIAVHIGARVSALAGPNEVRTDGRTEWIPPPHLDNGQSRVNDHHHPENYLRPDNDPDAD
jgi:class 3 adenylate cyclase